MTVMAESIRTPDAVTGIQLAQGIGVQQAKGFWADAWDQVLKRPSAILALIWLGVIAFFAVFAPVLANGHPLVLRPALEDGSVGSASYPLLRYLRSSDLALILSTLIALPWIFSSRQNRAGRLGIVIYGAVLVGIIVVASSFVRTHLAGRDLAPWALRLRELPPLKLTESILIPRAAVWTSLAFASFALLIGLLIPAIHSIGRRVAVVLTALVIGIASVTLTWHQSLEVFNYVERENRREIRATYTAVPFSPAQRFSAADRQPPGTDLGAALKFPQDSPAYRRTFLLGTDAFGQDVLTQLLSASRLAISIGLVSTGIAVMIGVTLGAIMGYFGGWIDLILFRLVEIVMAVPLLFLLIVAAAVLPPELRTAYTMMAIIGCFTWTSAARFTRAEFLKLRNQDFVQSAKAVGLPLRSVLFKHMLPNGVTPVLVDASFGIAAAIAIEATLSYLGLGPVDQASWGKLLASAMSAEGQFKWWLAVFPGACIFLTVLSYNLIGEALRDAIDPKLKKARV